MARIGLLGGTFNPIHNGHIRCALEVKQLLKLDRVDLLPNAIPPHKASPGVSAEHRLAMTTLAAQPHPQLGIDQRELNRAGNSYTVDTLAEIKQQQPQTQLYFIVGMDSLLSFHKWVQYQKILDLCHLIVCARPGYPLQAQSNIHAETLQLIKERQIDSVDELKQRPHGAIFLVESTAMDVSSTEIRAQLQHSCDSHYHLPKTVVEYIQQHQLYCD